MIDEETKENLQGDVEACFRLLLKDQKAAYLYGYASGIADDDELMFCYSEQPLLWRDELLFTPEDFRQFMKDTVIDPDMPDNEKAREYTRLFLGNAVLMGYVKDRIKAILLAETLKNPKYAPDSLDV